MLSDTIDPLLLAGSYATLATVSQQYARELLSERDREMSGGLGRAYRERGIAVEGITNGVDPAPWDPRFPERTGLPSRFDPLSGDLLGKGRCRESLMSRMGMRHPSGEPPLPLYAFVGRLTGQKGTDVLFGALRQLFRGERCPLFVILGQGEREQEDMFRRLASDASTAGRISFSPRYDPALAKLMYAASDFFLIPSAYEPCGLTDFIAQLLGSIPLVHRVGGLVKVRDGQTGFSYDEQSPAALAAAITRTFQLYRDAPDLLDRIRRRAFAEIYDGHTWDKVLAEGYLPLYARAVSGGSWTRS